MTAPSGDYGEEYWHERYGFETYEADLQRLMRWYRGLLRTIAPAVPPSGRYLDAGCGHGALVHLMHARGYDAYGFDLSRWMLEQALRFAPELAGHLAWGDAEQEIPFEGPFDLITCVEVVEHLSDPPLALRRLGAALRPGGRLVVTTPNLKPRIPWFDPVASEPTHINVHEPGWWRDTVSAAGLRPVAVRTYLALPLLWRVHPALSVNVPLGSTAGPGTLLVAERSQMVDRDSRSRIKTPWSSGCLPAGRPCPAAGAEERRTASQ